MRIFSLLAVACLSLNLSAQSLSPTDKETITTRLNAYFELTKANDYSGMMDYIYPKVFTIASREQMIQVFNGLEAMGVSMTVNDIVLNTTEPLYESADSKYALINYKADIDLRLLTAEMQSAEVVDALTATFKVQYNTKDITYDEESKTLKLKGNKYVVGVKDPAYDAENWYFLEYDSGNAAVSQMLLGNDVFDVLIEKLGK